MPKDKDKTDDDDKMKVVPADAPSDKAPVTDKPVDDKPTGDDKLLGKFDTADDLAKAYTELETKFGAQGKEYGDLKKTHTTLTSELEKKAAEADKAAAASGDPDTDFSAKLKDIQTRMEDGDITVPQAFNEQGELIAEMTMSKTLSAAEAKTQELLNQKDLEAAEVKFLEEYPDYKEVVESGELDKFKAKHPYHVDNQMAYFMFRESKAFEEGKAEQEKIAKGADAADTVLKTPGQATVRTPTRQKPLTDDELEAQQMGTLKKMGGGGA